MGTLGDSKLGPVRRTIAHLRHKGHDDAWDEQHRDGKTQNSHSKTEDYAGSATHALIRELFAYLNSSEGKIAMKDVVTSQAEIMANLAITDGAKEASRMAALQAVRGSYAAVGLKYTEIWTTLPRIVRAIVFPVFMFYTAASAIGFLACIWRVVLFGFN